MNTKSIRTTIGIFTVIAMAFAVFSVQEASASGVNGTNVTGTTYTDPDSGQSVPIKRTGNGVWVEYSPNGQFQFTEVQRDEWSVYLYDANRGMAMQIDLHQKKITYGAADPNSGRISSIFGAYSMTSAS
ncbi:MAG: hypothetical protein P1V20_18390 [Verrucomicrobiales bacterium]|nr:hypothetical protein [Verrucomicrobiales bacterium]